MPPASVLPEEVIDPRYRKHSHPAPWISGLLPSLARLSGFELRVFLAHRAIVKRCLAEHEGVNYEGLPSPVLERFAPHTAFYSKSLAISAAVRQFRPDLVHAFGMENGSATIALRMGFPVSCFIQGIAELLLPYYRQRGFVQKHVAVRCERNAARRIRWMIAETKFARNWVLSHQPEAHVALIPHPLRQAFLQISGEPRAQRVVSVGGLDDRKGMDTVIRAFSRVQNKAARLNLVGGGPSAKPLRQLALDLGVGDRVQFTGPRDTSGVIEELACASLFVIGSRMDTSPNVVTEAHAMGLPVIGTRAGGIPEMIDDGKDGFLVDVDDAGAMAKRIDELLANPERARQFGLAGREKVRVLNDPKRVAEAHVEFFEKIKGDLGRPVVSIQ
ncbi:MAG: glycosyltransferase family 4 protein [Verrucomicrobia bacterium]|nr:glycosyltransferase family 4 protein [Verrucomicrobiota bacterium]